MIKNLSIVLVMVCSHALADGHSNQYEAPAMKDKETIEPLIPRSASSLALRMPCDTTEYLVDFLTNEHQEKVLFDAEGRVYAIPDGRPPAFAQPMEMLFTMYVNQETGTWSFVGHLNGFSCLMTNGAKFYAGGK